MDSQNTTSTSPNSRYGMVHFILSHSYIMFLAAVVLGLICDVFLRIKIFNSHIYEYVGTIMIIAGSLLIYWAQSTSSATRKKTLTKAVEPTDFEDGPYRYSRNPTHIGLTIMTLGLAFVLNSVSSMIFIIIASLVTKFIFLQKEEALLEQRYGKPYADYKKKVSTWV